MGHSLNTGTPLSETDKAKTFVINFKTYREEKQFNLVPTYKYSTGLILCKHLRIRQRAA